MKYWFAPLSKGVRLSTVAIAVVERHSLRLTPTAAESVMYNLCTLTSSRICTVFTEEHKFPLGSLALEEDIPAAEWSRDFQVRLPDRFDAGSQSVSMKSIKITHEVVIKAEFVDADGLVSAEVSNCFLTALDTGRTMWLSENQIQEKIPFSIYMAPTVIGEDATIHGRNIECFQESGYAPPCLWPSQLRYGTYEAGCIPGGHPCFNQVSGAWADN